MQDQQNSRRLSLGFIAGVSVAILAVGGGTAWWAHIGGFAAGVVLILRHRRARRRRVPYY